MSFFDNILVPISQMIIYFFTVGGILYFIYLGIKGLFPNLKWNLKYKIFRFKYKEEDVKWCMDAIQKGMNEIEIKKFLLIKGQSIKKTNEIIYIFKKIKKKLKGGVSINDRQSK
jgi:hypothetical protein